MKKTTRGNKLVKPNVVYSSKANSSLLERSIVTNTSRMSKEKKYMKSPRVLEESRMINEIIMNKHSSLPWPGEKKLKAKHRMKR